MPQRTALLNAAEWFAAHRRALPWRDNPSPYRVWLSEIMLQQTTVAAAIPYFERFISCYPSLSDLAGADEQSVLSLWAGLGYYSRARNLLKTAQAIGNEEHFPQTLPELLALPGIGPYTAGAVASIAFNRPVALADTNVERVLGRFLALKRGAGFSKELSARASSLVEAAAAEGIAPSVWNQALMEIGALVCTPKAPCCPDCPFCASCLGKDAPGLYPGAKPKAVLRSVEENVLVESGRGGLILSQNTGKRRKGLWDFPLGNSHQALGSFGYRISNDKVRRSVFICFDAGRPLASCEARFFLEGPLPPLCSPARKILSKYRNIIEKVAKSLDKDGTLL